MSKTHEITRMLKEWSDGKAGALEDLLPVVYEELHKQAERYLRHERRNHTLQPTALINEVYLRLIGQHDRNWERRTHFFAISANLMRRILVDHARARHRKKRGGIASAVPLIDEAVASANERDLDLVALDEALLRLNEIDERQVKVVELRYFGGLTLEETAQALRISRTTVAEDWKMAKAWIRRELTR